MMNPSRKVCTAACVDGLLGPGWLGAVLTRVVGGCTSADAVTADATAALPCEAVEDARGTLKSGDKLMFEQYVVHG